ncbi:MAG: hypothetical protein ACOY5U_15145 [Pseudomonadota bacterium]
MQGMSERQYAARVGLSRGAIQKAKAAGRLVLHEDGSIDAPASDKRRAETTDPSKTRKPPAPKLKPVPEAAVTAVGDTLREQGLAVPAVGGGTTFLQAKTANEVLKAQERRIRLQKLKGELVDRARAETLMFRLARDERDAWVTWPARVAAQMASELNAALDHPDTTANGASETAVTTALIQRLLETHVRAQLDSLADVRPRLG